MRTVSARAAVDARSTGRRRPSVRIASGRIAWLFLPRIDATPCNADAKLRPEPSNAPTAGPPATRRSGDTGCSPVPAGRARSRPACGVRATGPAGPGGNRIAASARQAAPPMRASCGRHNTAFSRSVCGHSRNPRSTTAPSSPITSSTRPVPRIDAIAARRSASARASPSGCPVRAAPGPAALPQIPVQQPDPFEMMPGLHHEARLRIAHRRPASRRRIRAARRLS